MVRPRRPERNRAARSFRQLKRFHHVINSDKVFGTHTNRLHSKTITNLVGVEGADKLLENGKGRLPLKKLAQNIAFNAYISSTRQLRMTKQTDTGFNEHRPGNGAAVDDPGEVRPNESIERRRVGGVGQIELDRLVYGSYAIRR
jgi:hypothetical protein